MRLEAAEHLEEELKAAQEQIKTLKDKMREQLQELSMLRVEKEFDADRKSQKKLMTESPQKTMARSPMKSPGFRISKKRVVDASPKVVADPPAEDTIASAPTSLVPQIKESRTARKRKAQLATTERAESSQHVKTTKQPTATTTKKRTKKTKPIMDEIEEQNEEEILVPEIPERASTPEPVLDNEEPAEEVVDHAPVLSTVKSPRPLKKAALKKANKEKASQENIPAVTAANEKVSQPSTLLWTTSMLI